MKINRSLLLVFAFLTTSIFAQLPTNGLVAWYPFNANANDASGNNLNGTVINATLTTDRFGNNNSAYSFNGSSAYIRIEDNNLLDFTNTFSLCGWFKTNSTTQADQAIIGKGRASNGGLYDLLHNTAGSWTQFGVVTPPSVQVVSTPSTKYNTNWHFIVGTYDGQTLKLYIDDTLRSSLNTVFSLSSSTQPLFIGRELSDPAANLARFFNGAIDDVYLYNRAISQSEISQLFKYQQPCDIVITSQPSNQHTHKGDSISFSLNATGTSLSYKWQVKNGAMFSDLADGCTYSGSTTKKLTIATVSPLLNNKQYRCVVSGSLCKDSSTIINLIIDTTIYDTVRTSVTDTIYTTITDTIHHHLNDTIYTTINDTIHYYINDTIYTTITDTIHHNVNDTIYTTITDTSIITVMDTVRISVTDTLVIHIHTGLNNSTGIINTIKVYPNPAKDMLTIDNGNVNSMAGYSVKLINALGQTVFSSGINQQTLTIDLTTLSGHGIYFLQITDPTNNIVDIRKIVLQ